MNYEKLTGFMKTTPLSPHENPYYFNSAIKGLIHKRKHRDLLTPCLQTLRLERSLAALEKTFSDICLLTKKLPVTRKTTIMYRPLQMYSSSSQLNRREEEPVCPCLSGSSFTEWVLIIIMGVLALILGIVLLTHHSSDRVTFSAGVSMTAAGFIFVVLSVVLVVHKDNENWRSTALMPRLEAGRRAESSFYISQPLVLASTKL
ncbi:uncharacterized protein LOC103731571 [Nannospalax galili]|uniref:uncharacterized protein LOC103731571 n=1 Tax=Nannospalax galili TaxID=1026970 RepID=UPI0004ECFCE0|nr:uncharacterized protein LOC103731571 [Nannospalax galili]